MKKGAGMKYEGGFTLTVVAFGLLDADCENWPYLLTSTLCGCIVASRTNSWFYE
jgi:hypothetical protein